MIEQQDLESWAVGAPLEPVGQPLPRVDGSAKVTGRALYSADIRLPGQLYAAVLRSPHAHARVLAVDAEEARRAPGVHAVLTASDVGDLRWYEDEAPFFAAEVRFAGDEVAAVAATTRAAAEAALGRIAVEYEVLAHVTDPEAARLDGTPAACADGNLVEGPDETTRGDVEAGLADAAVLVEGVYRSPTAVHNALESHGCTAWWEDDRLTLYASTQGVNDVREMVADRLGVAHDQVRVVAEHVGGGFGAKQVPWKATIIAALLSRTSGRPVQLMLDRRAENLAAGKRNATMQRVRLGADADGRLVAIDADILVDGGAYSVAGESSAVDGPYLNLYACENVRTVKTVVRTNTGPAVAFRAPGYVESTFALESSMDELARRLDVDPIELRRRNFTDRDQQNDRPWSSPRALLRCYERVEEEFDWSAPPVETGDPDVRRGVGFAAHEWLAGRAMPPGYAWVELNADGTAHAVTAAQDIGTGTRTALAQVVAQELGLPVEAVRLSLGDTAAGPPAPTSSGSTTIPTMAPALRAAAADAGRQVLAAAAQLLEVSPDELEMVDGSIRSTSDDGLAVALTDVLEHLAPHVVLGQGGRERTNDDVTVHTFGAAAAEVEVDVLTGEVVVRRVVVAPDCGRILNPTLVDSQVIGGVTQGIGFALTEEQVLDHGLGVVVNANLEDYLVPTMADSCAIRHAAVDLPDLAANPLGVKGLGELPLIPVPAAIANAVRDAIGVRFHELPLTRRRTIEGLAGRERTEGGR